MSSVLFPKRIPVVDSYRAAVYLAINGYSLDGATYIKQFVQLQPWKQGFYLPFQAAMDTLVFHNNALERDTTYHYNTVEELEDWSLKYTR